MGKLEETLYQEIKELSAKFASCTPQEELILRDMILLNVEVLEEEKPHSSNLDHFRALSYFYDKNYTQALRYVIRALILAPEDRDTYLLFRKIRFEGRGFFRPETASACYQNGISLAQSKNYPLALLCLDTAVELFLTAPPKKEIAKAEAKKELNSALISLGKTYLELAQIYSKHDEQEQENNSALKRTFLANALVCLEEAKDKSNDVSLSYLEQIKEIIDYKNGEDYYLIGKVEEIRGNYKLASEHYKIALGKLSEEEPQNLALKQETVFNLRYCLAQIQSINK